MLEFIITTLCCYYLRNYALEYLLLYDAHISAYDVHVNALILSTTIVEWIEHKTSSASLKFKAIHNSQLKFKVEPPKGTAQKSSVEGQKRKIPLT